MAYRNPILPPFLLLLFQMHLFQALAAPNCPLDLSGSNFKMAASVCSSKQQDIGKCCRYINAFVAVSVARYANSTGNLGVTSPALSQICLRSISQTFQLYGISRNATVFCGFGTKISAGYDCLGRTTVDQMLHSPRFPDVSFNCTLPLSDDRNCKRCLNAGILYLRNLIVGADNITLSMCRDATFAAIAASQYDNNNVSAEADFANCFFGVQGLFTPPQNSSSSSSSSSSTSSSSQVSPEASPAPTLAASPSQNQLAVHGSYHLTLVPTIGIAVITVSIIMLVVLIFLIHRKSLELEDDSDDIDKTAVPSSVGFSQAPKKLPDGSLPVFRKFRYKDIKKATDNFDMIIGQGGFGTVYKAQFKDGSLAAVKRMDKDSEQAEDEFCREIELLARLHHRHLVALRGFCMTKHERFLVYEYMANGSLNDYLHASAVAPLSWQARIQIAIDVANALEYLHFYCNPPLCHRDVKSSNILLDDNLTAKVADFGLAHASKDGSVCFEAVNTEIRGTPGYMDPEYLITRELTEKSDVYSYGVVLLELLSGRRAIEDNKNLVEWSEALVSLSDSRLFCELVDPNLGDSYDLDQVQTLVVIVKWCTQREGRDRPSIKQVLRLLYECLDPMHSGFIEAVEGGEFEGEGEGQGTMVDRGRRRRSDAMMMMFHSGDVRCLASSSSTSRSYCSRTFLLETNSPPSS